MQVFQTKGIGTHHLEMVNPIGVNRCKGEVGLLGVCNNCEWGVKGTSSQAEVFLD